MSDTIIPAEATHWYTREGQPCYEVPRAKGNGTRSTTLGDARKLDLVPSVTKILKVAAQAGLEIWKAQQILESALTLPRLKDETLDDYALRVVEDSKVQSKKARDRGHELHTTIESVIKTGECFDTPEWTDHCIAVVKTLKQMGIDLLDMQANTEHSFASPLGYGGKIDFHTDEPLVLDFKTKDVIDDSKQLAYDEHCQQLAAYGFGLGFKKFRALNVFIGVNDKQVRVIEHEWPDLERGFAAFRCLLGYWQITKRFGPHAK